MGPLVKNHIPVGPIKTSAMLNGKPTYKTRRTGAKVTPLWIIVHSTANPTSNAMNERNWLVNINNTRAASWNYAVDERQIVEAIPAGELAYGTLDAKANHSSINIEMCESGDRVQVIRSTAALVAKLMHDWGIPLQNVVGHRRFQNKDCPRILQTGRQWDEFIRMVDMFARPTGMAFIVGKVPFSSPAGWIDNANKSQPLNEVAVALANNWDALMEVPYFGNWLEKVSEQFKK